MRRSAQSLTVVHTWWQEPQRTWLAVAAATLLLVARKPWALSTPQLWAEDGAVHLAQNDEQGAHAFFAPYRGYLHLLPRLIAWTASQLADVVHWPAIYNSAAFLIAIALFARLASRRFDLPGKPWLVLSFVLAAHTGEVWFNITNLHWLTSFFLVLQTLIARPATPAQRFGDLAILAVIGLTGPFVIVFLPLFAWRWWRERHGDNLVVLLTAATCAAVQIYFIKTAHAHFEPQAPLHLKLLLAVVGSRLVVWPLFGQHIAESLPWPALAAIGIAFIAALLLWALRPDPRRLLRSQIVVAFVLIASVCLWRIRPDTWAYPDLVNGDSYFYIARILLLWLLIWEFDGRLRPVAFGARALCIIGILIEIPHYRIATPPDYHWVDHCDAIRRGYPAKIPTLPEGFVFDYHGRPDGARPPAPLIPLSPPPNPGRLINASILTRLTVDEPSFTIGAVIGGAGTNGVKPLIVRAVGPSLAAVGVTDALADPELVIVKGQAQVAANDNWDSDGAAASMTAAFTKIGAFSLASPTSRDAAIAFNPTITAQASYTIQVRGHGESGVVLTELYDATPHGAFTRTTPRLINFSVLKKIPAGELLTAGFVIGGATSKQVLVRAIGPTLGGAFGLTGAMPDPKIELFDESRKVVADNNDWGGGARLVITFTDVGAFKLPAGSKDAAVVMTLQPGSYSAQVSGVEGSAGLVLVEVYEVP